MSPSEKTLALFPGALGDFLCFLPTVKELAARGSVDLLARSEYADLVPSEVSVKSLECCEVARLYVAGSEHEEQLRSFFGSYSRIYSWTGWGQNGFVGRLREASRGTAEIFPFLPRGAPIHPVDYYSSCIGGEHTEELYPTIRLKPDALAWSRWFWRCHELEGTKTLALAPGSGAAGKNWPAVFYREVADCWQRDWSGRVVVILGPVEEERTKIDLFFEDSIVVHCLSLANLAALIHRCDFYLGNDSGITHLAAALGKEVIALFGPTNPEQWAPRGKRVTVIRQGVECSPCEPDTMKSCPHRKCLTTLSPKDVFRTIEKIGQNPSSRPSNLLDKWGRQGLHLK